MPRKRMGFRNRFPHFGIFLVIAIAIAIPLTVWSLNNVSTQTKQHAATNEPVPSYFYSQFDPAWGKGICGALGISWYGCWPTSLAMAMTRYLSSSYTPYVVATSANIGCTGGTDINAAHTALFSYAKSKGLGIVRLSKTPSDGSVDNTANPILTYGSKSFDLVTAKKYTDSGYSILLAGCMKYAHSGVIDSGITVHEVLAIDVDVANRTLSVLDPSVYYSPRYVRVFKIDTDIVASGACGVNYWASAYAVKKGPLPTNTCNYLTNQSCVTSAYALVYGCTTGFCQEGTAGCCSSGYTCCKSGNQAAAGPTSTPTPTISPYSCLKIPGQACVSNSYACSAWGYKNGTCGASPCCQSTAYQCCQTNPNAATPTPTKAAATPTPTTGATGSCTGTQMGCGNRTTSANGVYPYYTTYATTQVCNNGTLAGNPNGGCPTGSYCALTAAGTAVCTSGCTQRGYTCQTGCTNGLAGGNNGYACTSGGVCCNPSVATPTPNPTTPPTSCCPSDSRVFAGQTQAFTTPNNCGNYDYNCDGQQTIVGTYYAQSGLTSSVRLNCVGGTCGSCTNGNYTPPFTNSYTTSCGQTGGTNCSYSYFNPGQTLCPASGTASYRAGCTSTVTACN